MGSFWGPLADAGRTPGLGFPSRGLRQQPGAVLAGSGLIPGRVVHPKACEPAEQHVVFQPLHDLPLRADPVEGLQQQRSHQPLWRDRRPAHARSIDRLKVRAQARQNHVHDRPDRSRRMVPPNPALQVHIRKQRPRPLIRSPHRPLPMDITAQQLKDASQTQASGFFLSLLDHTPE